MGYTEYWTTSGTMSDSEWENFIRDVFTLLKAADVPIAGPEGEGEMILTSNELIFNGQAPRLDHETFSFVRSYVGFQCTKTGAKPYTIPVQLCLLAASHWMDDRISVNSDGGKREWKIACRIWKKCFPKRKLPAIKPLTR